MRYISDDGKVFNSEHECLDHENKIKEEMMRKEELKKEKESDYNLIAQHSKELVDEMIRYENKYGEHISIPIQSSDEFINFLLRAL